MIPDTLIGEHPLSDEEQLAHLNLVVAHLRTEGELDQALDLSRVALRFARLTQEIANLRLAYADAKEKGMGGT